MPKVKVDFSRFYEIINKCYWNFFEDKSRIRLLYGGAGSGKSFYLTQEFIYKIVIQPCQNLLVIRKVANTHRTSTFALFQQVVSQLGLSQLFKINKSDLTIECIHNQNIIIFKGLDDGGEKIKSVTAKNGIITSIWIEEATELLQMAEFNQLNVRLRGESLIPLQITLSFNPISIHHWIYKEFFQNKSFQKNYSVKILKTTYLDNKFIDDDYRVVLEGYKEIDNVFYEVYCLGNFGVYGNVIFSNYSFEPIHYVDEDFDGVYPGMDYGFIHPSIVVKTGFKDGVMYSYAELCVFEKTNTEFIDANDEFNILRKNERCIADSAEPARIKEWVQKGYGVIGAKKGKDSVSRGIDFIKSQRWIIDPDRCPRLAQEVQQYHWKKDKDGNPMDEPVNLFDDAIKATIYGLEPLSGLKSAPLVLSGTKSDHKKDLIEIKKEERRKKREVLKAQARQKRLELKKK